MLHHAAAGQQVVQTTIIPAVSSEPVAMSVSPFGAPVFMSADAIRRERRRIDARLKQCSGRDSRRWDGGRGDSSQSRDVCYDSDGDCIMSWEQAEGSGEGDSDRHQGQARHSEGGTREVREDRCAQINNKRNREFEDCQDSDNEDDEDWQEDHEDRQDPDDGCEDSWDDDSHGHGREGSQGRGTADRHESERHGRLLKDPVVLGNPGFRTMAFHVTRRPGHVPAFVVDPKPLWPAKRPASTRLT